MLNYAQKTPMIIYNTSRLKIFLNLSYLQSYIFFFYNHIFFSVDYMYIKKTIRISVDSTRDSDKLQQNQDPL